jgi:hypothetical protein
MAESTNWFLQELETRGVSRREFVGFAGLVDPHVAVPRHALEPAST